MKRIIIIPIPTYIDSGQ